MKIDLTFAELHTPMFLGKINWGLKLYEQQAKGHLALVYDRENKELLVRDLKMGAISIIPTSNVVSMTPKVEVMQETVNKPALSPGRTKAQASSPVDHVFQGPSAGKTNDK